jgi:hypothetical protein
MQLLRLLIDFNATYLLVWVFVCKDCLVDVKKDNTAYKYGGTWKK